MPGVDSILRLGIAGCAVGLFGCASYPLHANLEDAELRTRLAANLPHGMSEDAVKSTLVSLRVPERVQMRYPATGGRPEVLLARLFPPGGFWVDDSLDTVEFVDVSFVFDPTLRLDRTVIYRDQVRYFQGDLVKGPTREPMTRPPRYPGMPPPPADPLEGAN